MDDKNSQEESRFSQMMTSGGRAGSRIAKGPIDAQPQHGPPGTLQESQMQELYSNQPQPQQHGKHSVNVVSLTEHKEITQQSGIHSLSFSIAFLHFLPLKDEA